MTKPSIIERIFFWIGSVCGIALSAFAINDKFTESSPPQFDVQFANSENRTIYLRPPINSCAKWTEELPIDLIVKNIGGKSGQRVILQLSYSIVLRIKYDSTGYQHRITTRSNEVKDVMTIPLSDIHPGETLRLHTRFSILCDETFKDYVLHDKAIRMDSQNPSPLSYRIETEISAIDCRSELIPLFITVGNGDLLRRFTSEVFYLGHDRDDFKKTSILVEK